MTSTKVTRDDLVRLWAAKSQAMNEEAEAKRKAAAALKAYWDAYDEFHKDDDFQERKDAV